MIMELLNQSKMTQGVLCSECRHRYGINTCKMLCIYINKNTIHINLYAFILLTSATEPGINYFLVIIPLLHQLQVWKRSSNEEVTGKITN